MINVQVNDTKRLDCDPCPERIKWIIHDRRWVGILDSIGVLVVFIVLTACVTYLVRLYYTKWRTRTLTVQRKSSIIANVDLSLFLFARRRCTSTASDGGQLCRSRY